MLNSNNINELFINYSLDDYLIDKMINKVMLIGRVGSEPEVKVTTKNEKFAKLSLATSKKYKSGGINQEKTAWHMIKVFDPRLAENVERYVHKGTIETVYSLLDGEYEFIEAEIIETSELINKSLKDSNLPEEIRIGAIVRKKEIIIPKADFKFEKKDLVVFLTKREHLEKVESLFRISSLV